MTHNFDFNEPSKTNPFSVPDGYFENFALKMENKTALVRISLWDRTKPYMYAAAMFVLIFGVGLIFFKTNNVQSFNQLAVNAENQTTKEIIFDNVSADDITEYLFAEGY